MPAWMIAQSSGNISQLEKISNFGSSGRSCSGATGDSEMLHAPANASNTPPNTSLNSRTESPVKRRNSKGHSYSIPDNWDANPAGGGDCQGSSPAGGNGPVLSEGRTGFKRPSDFSIVFRNTLHDSTGRFRPDKRAPVFQRICRRPQAYLTVNVAAARALSHSTASSPPFPAGVTLICIFSTTAGNAVTVMGMCTRSCLASYAVPH